MNRRNRIGRKGRLLAAALLVALCMLSGCGDAGYTKDGGITLKDSKDGNCKVQIAEIQEKDGETTVYVRGTGDYTVCQYQMGDSGFAWEVFIAMEMKKADGTTLEPAKVTPYMTGKSTGNAVSFTFEGVGDYSDIFMYQRDNKEGGVEIPISKLEIPEDLKMSDSVVKLQ